MTLAQRLLQTLSDQGGWMPFDQFMATALYEPGLGYYTSPRTTFGRMPDGRTTAAGAAQPGVMPAPPSDQARADAAPPAPVAVGSDFVTAPELSPLFGQTQIGRAHV